MLLQNVFYDGQVCDILIQGNKIARIAPHIIIPNEETLDCSGKAILPSFANTHTHASMMFLRGVGEDKPLFEWLNESIWPLEAKLKPEHIYPLSRFAILEMIKTGTTFFCDMYCDVDETVKAVQDMGIRAMIPYVGAMDVFDSNEFPKRLTKATNYMSTSSPCSRIIKGLSCHAIYTTSEKMIRTFYEMAREQDTYFHIHISETRKEVEDCMKEHGMSPVEYLDSLGILGPDVIAAHTLWLSDNDVRILGERGVTCVHNINSNLKLASGYRFRYNELRAAGANVCLGTDGCGSSNNLDILEAMKTSAIVQKAWRDDPSAMPLDELAAMVSTNAAKALGINAGQIKEGMLADILIIDTDNYQFLSPAGFLANLVYSAHSDCVDSVICDGKFIMRGRVVEGEKEIIDNAREQMYRVWIQE